MAEVTYGPKGTTLIQVGNTFYLAYDNGASILYWELSKGVDLSTITNINPSFVNQFDSQGKLIAGKDIEGYMYINQDDWDLQIVEGDRLVKAGNILEIVDDVTNIIEATVSTLANLDERLPWAKNQDFLDLVVELRTEDSENWKTNMETDSRFYNILNEVGYTKEMYDNKKSSLLDELGFNKLKENYAKQLKNSVSNILGKLDDNSINYAASKWALGEWSGTTAIEQVTKAVDNNFDVEWDMDFKAVVDGGTVTLATGGQAGIQNLMDIWLPKAMHANVNVLYESSKVRQSPFYQDELVEKFKDMRFQGGYSMYDRDFSWKNIVQPILNKAESIWGVVIDETDDVVQDLIQINDASKVDSILRETGLQRGYQKTQNDATMAMMQAFGQGIVPVQDYQTRIGVDK